MLCDLRSQLLGNSQQRQRRKARGHLWFVSDILCTMSIVQGGQGLILAVSSGSNGCNDASFCLASQRVPQQPSEFTVPTPYPNLSATLLLGLLIPCPSFFLFNCILHIACINQLEAMEKVIAFHLLRFFAPRLALFIVSYPIQTPIH